MLLINVNRGSICCVNRERTIMDFDKMTLYILRTWSMIFDITARRDYIFYKRIMIIAYTYVCTYIRIVIKFHSVYIVIFS